jgi:hypothetical protein
MGSPYSLLFAVPSGAESTGMWVDTPSWQRISAVEAKFTHTHTEDIACVCSKSLSKSPKTHFLANMLVANLSTD